MQLTPVSTYNYLVPADGTTHCVVVTAALTGNPVDLDWLAFKQSNFNFYPQGCFVDNSQGTVPLIISIPSIQFKTAIPAGCFQLVGFPSPANCVMQLTGLNAAAILDFVDYPVVAGASTDASGIPAGNNVSITNTPLPTADQALDPIITAVGAPAANAATVQSNIPAITLSTPLNASTVTGASATISLLGQRIATAFVSATVAATGNVQVSPDGANWYNLDTINFTAAGSIVYTLPPGLNSARFDILTNTGAVTAQVAAIANNGMQS